MSKRDEDRNESGRGGVAAVAEKERHVSNVGVGNDERSLRREVAEPESGGRGFFDLYKPGQGYYTRIWSGVASASLVCWFAYFLYEKLGVLGTGATTRYIQVSAAVGVILAFGLLGYWLLGLNRRVCDFLIATEGEMKKVNWTSRKEILGSTKVVCFVVIAMAVILFVVDVLFMLFFNAIGILKAEGLFSVIQGLFR